MVVGYVVMPEHVHLLLSEPERDNPASVIQVLKQRFARAVLRELRTRSVPGQQYLWKDSSAQAHVWQARFYDFVVYTKKKRMEKLHYIHQNPVQRGLVLEAGQWKWSSFGHYAGNEPGPVVVNEALRAEMKVRAMAQNDLSAA